MAVSDWSTTPSSNANVAGIDNRPTAARAQMLENFKQVMAQVADWRDTMRANSVRVSDGFTAAEIAQIEARNTTVDHGEKLQAVIDLAAASQRHVEWDIGGGLINTSVPIQMRSNVVLWTRDRWNVMRSGGPSYNPTLIAAESIGSIRLLAGANANVVEFGHDVIRSGMQGISVDGNKAENPDNGNCVVFLGAVTENRTSNFLDNCQIHGARESGVWAQSGQLEVRLHRIYSHDHEGAAIFWESNDAFIDDSAAGYSEWGLLATQGNMRAQRFDAFGNTIGVELRDVLYGHFYALQSNSNARNGLIVRGVDPLKNCQQLRFLAGTFTDNSTEGNGLYSGVLSLTASGSNHGIVFDDCSFGLLYEDAGSQKYAFETAEAVAAATTFTTCQFKRSAFGLGLVNNGFDRHIFQGCQDVDGTIIADSAPVPLMTRTGDVVSAAQGTGYDYRSASFTAVAGIAKYLCNTGGGSVTATLPAADSVAPGYELVLVKQGAANTLSVAAGAGDTVDGTASVTADRAAIRLFSDGTSAWISY